MNKEDVAQTDNRMTAPPNPVSPRVKLLKKEAMTRMTTEFQENDEGTSSPENENDAEGVVVVVGVDMVVDMMW